ncbi:Receptor-type tyrosine-protein phosphatase gamma, partial [Araneus ventricosus]
MNASFPRIRFFLLFGVLFALAEISVAHFCEKDDE